MGPEHCEILLTDDRLSVRDLGTDAGTFVNDNRIHEETLLVDGDRLRIGRLEFAVIAIPDNVKEDAPADPMSEFVSDMLGEADEEDRARRMADPLLRQFDVSAVEPPEAQPSEPVPPEAESGQGSKSKVSRPTKKPPGKLPPPPEFVADDSVQAAQETLKKIFERPKK